MTKNIIGWDIGGAHIKAALINDQGVITRVVQYPCPLWQGLHELQNTVKVIQDDLNQSPEECLHGITMTGELVDLFTSRADGVQQIVEVMSQLLGADKVLFYTGISGMLKPVQITDQHWEQIASANWLASVSYIAQHRDTGLFVDIGSTTSDILLFSQTQPQALGFSDYQRLCSQELVYTGIVRTPLMAVTRDIEFQGQDVGLMAEYFATMADVYRITGELDERHDQMPAADNGDKSKTASLRRLARMIGCDVEDFSQEDWLQLAERLKAAQLQQLHQACIRQLDRGLLSQTPVLVGAGVGKFLARELATLLGLDYQDFTDCVAHQVPTIDMNIADCAPAVAVACLTHSMVN